MGLLGRIWRQHTEYRTAVRHERAYRQAIAAAVTPAVRAELSALHARGH